MQGLEMKTIVGTYSQSKERFFKKEPAEEVFVKNTPEEGVLCLKVGIF
jgi:hypothetical protein